MKAKRVLFFVTVVAILLSVFACSSTPSGTPDLGGRPADRDTRYPVRKFLVEIGWWDNQFEPPPNLYPGKGVAGAKFDVDFIIRSFAFCMPTLHEDVVNSAVFRLFKWNNSYNETINSEPIVVITRRNIRNNEIVVFEIDDNVAPPGTYLWTLSDATSRDPDAIVAIWSAIPAPDLVIAENTVFYLDGYETEEYLYKTIISGVRPASAAVQPAAEESSDN